MKDIYSLLKTEGFIIEGKDDYSSADGGLPIYEYRIKNHKNEYIGDFLTSLGFKELEVKTISRRGEQLWTAFKKEGMEITHRKFGEKNIFGDVVKINTFSIDY